MRRHVRAVGALAATALVSSALALGVSAPAQGGSPPGQSQRLPVIDLPIVDLPDAGLLGSGTVGKPLRVLLDGVATLLPVQWLRDGSPIPGETGDSYTPKVDDIGHAISAVITLPLLGPITTPAITIVGKIIDPGDPGDPTDPTDPTDPADVLELLSGGTLPGSAEVGRLVTLLAPVWSLPGVTTTYQWLRDGAPIPGADGASYIVDAADAGRDLAVRITGTLAGLPVISLVTDALPVPEVTAPQIVAVGDVTLTGSRKVGTVVRASGPTWDPAEATSSYQWLRDGAPIADATDTSYSLSPVDFGHSVSVAVTGSLDGYTSGTITSDPIEPLVGDAITFATKPRLTGKAKLGKQLTADPGRWTGGSEGSSPPAYGYQWLRDGTPISGAVAQTYQVARADIGHALAVAITAARPGYREGRFTTATRTVPKVASTVRAKVARSKIRKGTKAVLRIVVKARSGLTPTGRIRVLDRKRQVRTIELRKAAQGRKTVRLGGLKVGVHKLRVVYVGSAKVAGARSSVVKLRVRR